MFRSEDLNWEKDKTKYCLEETEEVMDHDSSSTRERGNSPRCVDDGSGKYWCLTVGFACK